MSRVSTVAIAGITGGLASLIVKYLLENSAVQIKGICRESSKLPESLKTNPRISIFRTEVDDIESIRSAVRGADVTICCYAGQATFMISSQKTLINACVAENVPRYIAADWSINFRNLEPGEHPHQDLNLVIKSYLEEKEKETDGKFKAIHIVNGIWIDRPWMMLWNAKDQSFQYWGTGNEKWQVTSQANSAEYTACIALDPTATGWFSFLGDSRTLHEIAADFTSAYGKTPGLVCLGSLEDLHAKMVEMGAAASSQPGSTFAWLMTVYLYFILSGKVALQPERLDNARYPQIKTTTVREYFEGTRLEELGVFKRRTS